MPSWVVFASDIVAIVLLAYAVYFRRHQRRDMLLAFIGLNIGVLAVATALDRGAVGSGLGLGLGLFGVLSIVRLRSSELSQEEVAYYFVSLAMGLLGGVRIDPVWVSPALMAVMVVTMFVVDHPRLLAGARQQTMNLDGAFTDEAQLATRLEAVLGADITRVVIRKVDMVRETTLVDVRYRLRPRATLAGLHDDAMSRAGAETGGWR